MTGFKAPAQIAREEWTGLMLGALRDTAISTGMAILFRSSDAKLDVAVAATSSVANRLALRILPQKPQQTNCTDLKQRNWRLLLRLACDITITLLSEVVACYGLGRPLAIQSIADRTLNIFSYQRWGSIVVEELFGEAPLDMLFKRMHGDA